MESKPASGVRSAAASPSVTAKRKDKPLFSLIAGTTAGAVEGFATYPIEYTKTVAQFASKSGEKAPGPITIVRNTLAKDGFIGLYNGCGALVAGNALKAGVRFLSYDHFKSILKDDQGKLSGPRSLLAGLGAGMMEAIFAVTPSETIKTKLIDDGKRQVRKYPSGLIPGTAAIVREEGIRGIYRGLFPVMMRQGANSAVRFGTYSSLKNFVAGSTRPGQSLPGGVTFGIGAVAGIVTVYTTMPFDVIKTRMQSLEARSRYTGTLNCISVTLREEGLKAFWRGATPRLARLVLSGGIVFTVYEEIMSLLDSRTA
ncbi:mitochondrial carrier [Violaceomyces palustris]|uniref:Mitochondrial carrier n=1 Tax=Violaceomyces palustris TaxID=1673888 RepID=A0ACD0NWJ0_9BASI|nr:mitochondrial carrier [Violaceomyces palustris]